MNNEKQGGICNARVLVLRILRFSLFAFHFSLLIFNYKLLTLN